MQGVLSHSVYWVAFCGVIHGSLLIKVVGDCVVCGMGSRVDDCCAEHINTDANGESTLLGKPPINKDREGNRTPYFAGIPLDTCTKTTF